MKFIIALSGLENQNLLKEEVKHFYPKLKLSFSQKNFLTFKLENDRDLFKILERRPAFARLWMEGGEILKTPTECGYLYKRESDELLKTDKDSKNLLIEISEKSWMEIKNIREQDLLLLNPKVEEDPKAPSRAYYKLAEAFKLTKMPLGVGDYLLELGSSPGGATYFALQSGAKVLGVDPGEMESFLFDDFKETFKHLKEPVQKVDPLDLPMKINYVAVDMNLNPHQSLKETLRLMEELKNVKALFFTFKLVKMEHIPLLDQFRKKVEKTGFKVEYFQLPTHRKECLLFAKRL